ncbi:MAG: response regulator [Oculatellaceae cyanobacterium bins.114]|nr:response regulator [Oculatellaceae cyanobacterium bins.114]
MNEPLNVLIVEDSEDDALLVLRELRRGGFDVTWERVITADALLTMLPYRSWDVLISDYRLPGFDAPTALEILKHSQLDIPFIVVSGTIGETLAVELMKAGAHDYLMKGNLTRLPEAVRREVRDARIRVERQQATLELDQTKERLQLAIEGSGIGLWDWSVQTGTVTFNDRWAEMIGYTLQELEPIGIETWRHNTHPKDLQKANLLLEQHFSQEIQVYECEMRMRHKSGTWVWVLARGKVVEWDEAGNPLRMIGTHLDISDRKRSESTLQQLNRDLEERVERRTAALQQSEARLREAQQVARLGSWELDVQTKELAWSAEIFNIFGLNPDEAAPTYEQLIQNYFPPHDRSHFINLVDRAIQYGEPYATDLKIIRADGSSGYIFAKAEVSCNSTGHVNRLFGIAMDISDRKAIQEALQRSEERARATLLALPDLVFRVNRNGQYVDFLTSQPNNMVEPAQVIGKSIFEGLASNGSGVHAKTQYDAMQQALATQTVQSYEQQIWLEDKPHYEEVRVAPCGNDEVVFFVRDISDRKESEAQLQRTNEELARATRLKDEFLANMSHELRTPLTAILGMSETLKEEIFGELNAKQHQYVEVISNSGKHLLQLINDILDVSKISAGKLELDISTVSIDHLCASSLVFIRQDALKKQIRLITSLPPNLGAIEIDERRIRQVLINLLNNAVKFTPACGQITLEVTIQKSSCDPPNIPDSPEDTLLEKSQHSENLVVDHWILFSITDTGIGIAPEDQTKLFRPFVQIDSSLNRHYEGTGLGLTLVKQIVELHGGSVSLRSQLGQGSCFTVRLPYRSSHQEMVFPTLSTDIYHKQTCTVSSEVLTSRSTEQVFVDDRPIILLAEDNQGNIDTLSSYLEVHDYQMLIARNGQEAIDLTQMHCPDLILMDIQMPGVDGLTAIQTIRQDLHLANIPIIALTALAMEGDRDRCLKAGANDYLAKPVKLKQLVATIRHLLDA